MSFHLTVPSSSSSSLSPTSLRLSLSSELSNPLIKDISVHNDILSDTITGLKEQYKEELPTAPSELIRHLDDLLDIVISQRRSVSRLDDVSKKIDEENRALKRELKRRRVKESPSPVRRASPEKKHDALFDRVRSSSLFLALTYLFLYFPGC